MNRLVLLLVGKISKNWLRYQWIHRDIISFTINEKGEYIILEVLNQSI